jgi:hypothetical protein
LEKPGFSEFAKKFGNKFGPKKPVFEAKTHVLGQKEGFPKITKK